MKLSEIGTSIETLSGVGPSTAKLFARQSIFTIADLLSNYPRDYEDRTKRVCLHDFAQYPKVHTICKVTGQTYFGYGRMKTLKIAVTDSTANAWLIAFNRPFLEKTLPVGSIIAVTGTFQVKYNELQSTAFEAVKLSDDGDIGQWKDAKLPDTGVLPIYPLTEGLSNKTVRKAVQSAISKYVKAIDNELPPQIIKERNLLSKSEALRKIHLPVTNEDIATGRRTLIYEELYNFEYKMALRALAHRGKLPTFDETAVFEKSALSTEIPKSDTPNSTQVPDAAPFFTTPDLQKEKFEKSLSPKQKALYERLTFSLTQDQMKCIEDMNFDIDKSMQDLNTLINKLENLKHVPFSMQRLLQGDVGSGKTLVSFFVCLRTLDYGGQCALLAPTELLARQHAENASRLLEPIGVKVAFLTGNVKSAGRKILLKALKEGNIDIAIGTHALFAQDVVYKNLSMAVIDEQHRFGVAQRESIIAKGRITGKSQSSAQNTTPYSHSPDVLMMSATPIPQTLALTAFGDLDISIIRTMPAGRKTVKTYLSVMGHESNVYEAVRKELEAGHQAYFVYPRIGINDDMNTSGEGTQSNTQYDSKATSGEELKAAQDMFDFLSKEVYPKFCCALVHSKIAEDEQHKILDSFHNGEIQILVATTVVEVGVDNPNATCIVIEHADRFGLAELHQLRGRVGRSSLQSYCFLIYSKNITQTGIARLKALHENTDGFIIAEEDLKLRGPGEVTGTAQSGYLSLGLADISRDKELLQIARYDAFQELSKITGKASEQS